MIEDHGVARPYRYHKLRLLHTFVAMRSFRVCLLSRGLAGKRLFRKLRIHLVRVSGRARRNWAMGENLQVAEIQR